MNENYIRQRLLAGRAEFWFWLMLAITIAILTFIKLAESLVVAIAVENTIQKIEIDLQSTSEELDALEAQLATLELRQVERRRTAETYSK